MKMVPRIVPGLAAAFVLAVSAGEATAQYYPPDPYYPPGQYYPPGPPRGAYGPRVYRAPTADDDEYGDDQPVYRGPAGRDPYQRSPYDQRSSDRTVDRQPLPSPGAGAGQAAPPYGAPPYGAPYDERLSDQGIPGQGPGMRRGDDGMPAMRPPSTIGSDGGPGAVNGPRGTSVATLPPDYQAEEGAPTELPPELRRQTVGYPTREPAGTIVIDTPNTHLYLVLGNGQAMRYGIGVGREGFAWAGVERVSRMTEWPDWFPPKEMIERQPYLPRMMAGGPANPLGARALYLGNTLYRIHGTNQPSTIGKFVSSGCIRMLNQDVEDLFGRAQVGTRVVVLGSNGQLASNTPGYVPSVSATAAKPKKSRPVRAATISRAHPAPAAATAPAAAAVAPTPAAAPAAAAAPPADEQKASPDAATPSSAAPVATGGK